MFYGCESNIVMFPSPSENGFFSYNQICIRMSMKNIRLKCYRVSFTSFFELPEIKKNTCQHNRMWEFLNSLCFRIRVNTFDISWFVSVVVHLFHQTAHQGNILRQSPQTYIGFLKLTEHGVMLSIEDQSFPKTLVLCSTCTVQVECLCVSCRCLGELLSCFDGWECCDVRWHAAFLGRKRARATSDQPINLYSFHN